MKKIEQIADRAHLLTSIMSHGNACWAACREAEIPESELAATASIVSTLLTDREIKAEVEASRTPEALALQKEKEATRDGALVLVAAWAKATGRTGSGGKQSRQAKIRTLQKHGLNGAYAAKIRAEIEKPGFICIYKEKSNIENMPLSKESWFVADGSLGGERFENRPDAEMYAREIAENLGLEIKIYT